MLYSLSGELDHYAFISSGEECDNAEGWGKISPTFLKHYLGFEEINWVAKTKHNENTKNKTKENMIKNLAFPYPNPKYHSLQLDNLDLK